VLQTQGRCEGPQRHRAGRVPSPLNEGELRRVHSGLGRERTAAQPSRLTHRDEPAANLQLVRMPPRRVVPGHPVSTGGGAGNSAPGCVASCTFLSFATLTLV